MNEHYDDLEVRPPEVRERELLDRLPGLIELARRRAPAHSERLRDVEGTQIRTREALARLPLLRKSELVGEQRERPPFGGFATNVWGPRTARVFVSPGPLHEPEGARPDYWRMARALYAAGFRAGMLVHNSFSYHFTPAGAMLESGAHALGCSVFPAGVGQTEQQVQAIDALKPQAYVGTPSFLGILLDKADELGLAPTSLRCALVSGEAFPALLRERVAERGVRASQVYATADLGQIAYETQPGQGLVVGEDLIVEIVRPGTGDPLPAGEVGEIVVTSFNPDYPLIRFATGDLSAVLPGVSPCGRTNMRLRGWLGRADQTTKVRGMFVHPGQIAEVLRRYPELGRARLVVDNPEARDRVRLLAETASETEGLGERLVATLREFTKLRCEVELRAPGTLPNDGKLIEDLRALE
jgi:phenylacetate-CoA ligase